MSAFSIPLTRIVHENLSILMCFAFSRTPLERMFEETFVGEWKYLAKAVFGISEQRAEKACLELALFLRMLDDEEGISAYHRATTVPNCGRIVMKDGSESLLTFREVANKVIHTSRLEWQIRDGSTPILIAHGRDKEKWSRAEIDVVALASVCGTLMS